MLQQYMRNLLKHVLYCDLEFCNNDALSRMYMMFMRRGKITDVLNALSPLLEMTPWISIEVDPRRLGMFETRHQSNPSEAVLGVF